MISATHNYLTLTRDILLSVGLGSYILGHVIWSVYFYKLGVDFTPGEDSQYFISGFFPLILVSGCVFLFLSLKNITAMLWSDDHNDKKIKKFKRYFYSSLIIIFFLISINAYTSIHYKVDLFSSTFTYFLYLVLISLLLLMPTSEKRTRYDKWLDQGVPMLILIVGSMTYMLLIFPIIPQALGGVKEECVYIAVDKNHVSKDMSEHVVQANEKYAFLKINLINSGNQYVLLNVPNKRESYLKLHHRAIGSIQYCGEYDGNGIDRI